ncbi:MAG: hypothetical protein Q8K29_06350 [Polaromonas sp.]|nr:hypothetical protein [Polaromonas sp.]
MNNKLWAFALMALLTACAGPGGPSGQQSWRCEHGIDFRVRFVDDSALLEGTRANEVLFRDAGGQGPQQSVYSNSKMRAEFGLGANGREALLTYPALPLKARCVRD